jgi:glutamine amidotransferase
MCLAIYKPAATSPDWSAYRNGFAVNDDSWGFAAAVDGAVVTRCGIGNFDEFRTAFEPYADSQAIIHFRWATHGKKDTGNCHPFMVSDSLAVIHNGVISIKCDVDKDRSDTWHFNELVLKPMHKRDACFYRRSDVVYTQELAHSGSKFVFLHADGDYFIWNEGDGDWARDGHWYSNDSHEGNYYRTIGYGTSARTTTPSTTKAERDWLEVSDGRWSYADDDDCNAATSRTLSEKATDDEDEQAREAAFYTDLRVEYLMQYGFSRRCLEEVHDVLGDYGIEILHDAT